MAMQIRKINIGTRDTVHVVALSAIGATDARAMDVSPDGTLYVADAGRDVVIKVFESGTISGAVVGHISTAGNVNADGITVTGNTARLNTPMGLCVDNSNNIYVGDGGSGFQIRRMSPSGRIVFMAGNYDFAGNVVNAIDTNDGTAARFSPTTTGMGMAVDKAGIVYMADTGNSRIKKIWPSGKTTSMAGDGTSSFANATGGSAKFNVPLDCCVDSHGNVYVADKTNNRIRKVTESGVVTTLSGGATGFTDGAGGDAQFALPVRVCMDPSDQFLYVMDKTNAAIRKVETSGKTTTFCHYNVPSANSVGDICVDNSGFLYILENNS